MTAHSLSVSLSSLYLDFCKLRIINLPTFTPRLPTGNRPAFMNKMSQSILKKVWSFIMIQVKFEEIISAETKRLCSEYGKSFLDCDDIIALTGLGRDNVRALMRRNAFPVVKVGKRQVVSILAFVTWQLKDVNKEGHYYGNQ